MDSVTYPLNATLRQNLITYLENRPFKQVSELIQNLQSANVTANTIQKVAQMISTETPCQLLSNLQSNVDQVNQARVQAKQKKNTENLDLAIELNNEGKK